MSEIILTPEEQLVLKTMEDLNAPRADGLLVGLKTRLHEKQIECLSSLYVEGKKLVFVPCGRKFGKDLDLNEKVLTKNGWLPIRFIQKGDEIYSGLGELTKVVDISPVYTDNVCYKIHFNDGTNIVAGEDHEWFVGNKHDTFKVLKTKELTPNWFRIPLPIVKGTKKEYLINPYLLGLWLGDGSSYDSKFTSNDDELFDAFANHYELGCRDGEYTRYIKGMSKHLKSLNLIKNKHIPADYMNGDFGDRLQVFQGLMDTDGYVDKRGVCEFVQKNETLFHQVVDLGRSLGIRIHINKDKIINGVHYKRFSTSPNIQIFGLNRKRKRLEPFIKGVRRLYKNIVKVEKTVTRPTMCINVECPSHSFITTNYTITHNSEVAGYAAWRQALTVPGSAIYYVAPEASHGRKIMWDTQRLQRFLGRDSIKYVDRINNLEMKVMFKNRSFIQIIGSENWASANGLTPDLVIYDEYKVFHPQFHIEMDPNRAAKGAALLIIGTQPKVGDRNKEQYEALLEYAKMHPSRAAVYTYSTFDNPINLLPDRKMAIEEQIKILRMRGEEDVVQREYFSRIVPGGSRAIFPMLNKEVHVAHHDEIIKEISNDLSKLEWYISTDPGTTTCFAALYAAVNPYTKKMYILDEIYEKDQSRTSVTSIYPRMEAGMKELYPGSNIEEDWVKGYDEAAVWMANEIMQQYGIYFIPTDKVNNKKEAGLSLIKDQLIHDLVVISDRCKWLVKEMEEYAKDDKGNIPKKNDHLIDCFRYLNSFANYSMIEVMEAIRKKNDSDQIKEGRMRRPFDDDFSDNMDWTDNIFFDF